MIHNIRYRVFIYENEDKDEILEALLNILPTAEPEVEEAEGLLEEKMLILTGTISKKRETKEFLNTLIESIGEDQLAKLYNDLDRKMDEKGNLFLRLSKEKAMEEVCSGNHTQVLLAYALARCRELGDSTKRSGL